MLAICIHHFCTYRVVLILIVSAIIMHSILLHLSTSLMSPMRALPNSLGNGNNGCRKMHVSWGSCEELYIFARIQFFLYLFIIFNTTYDFVHFYEIAVSYASNLWAVGCEGLNRLSNNSLQLEHYMFMDM